MKLETLTKAILKVPVFGAFYILWTAPVDEPKAKLPAEEHAKSLNPNFKFKMV